MLSGFYLNFRISNTLNLRLFSIFYFSLAMDKWKPSKDQQSGSISRTFDFFIDELNELQIELDCPDEFIYDFLQLIRNRWSPDSCHSRARQHKRDNSGSY